MGEKETEGMIADVRSRPPLEACTLEFAARFEEDEATDLKLQNFQLTETDSEIELAVFIPNSSKLRVELIGSRKLRIWGPGLGEPFDQIVELAVRVDGASIRTYYSEGLLIVAMTKSD